MKTVGDGSPKSQVQGQTCSYSRRKAEKQTRGKVEDNNQEIDQISLENKKLVDSFVQDVIEKATNEYCRQKRENSQGLHKNHKRGKHDKDKENGSVVPDNSRKTPKRPGKDKHKHRHHYKYSDPVDEKEISKYEQVEEDSLLEWNPNFGEIGVGPRKNPSTRSRVRNRFVVLFRRIVGCCFGKT